MNRISIWIVESFPICIIECNNVRCNKWEVRHFTSGVSIIICNNWFPLGFVIKMPPVSLVVEDMKLNMQMLSANPQPHITKCFTSGILIGAGQTGSLSSILQYQPLNKYWTVLCYLDDEKTYTVVHRTWSPPFPVIFWTPGVFSVPQLMSHLLPLALRIL